MFEQAQAELSTVRDLLRFAVSRFNEAKLFFGHGADNAWDEAAYLLLHTLHLPLARLEPFLEARLTSDERASVLRIIERRVSERLPVAYLTNEAWLGDCSFYVDERVIVPRSFIAELLREQLAPWIDDPEQVAAVLDLCTGSGCLAILAARAFPAAAIDATDISPDALAVARRNVADYDLAARIRLVEGDLFAGLKKRRYDLIIANPPYVSAAAVQAFPPEYRAEPVIAHLGGRDGLDAVRAILDEAPKHMSPGGKLVVEIGTGREVLEAERPELNFLWLDTAESEGEVFALDVEPPKPAAAPAAKKRVKKVAG